MSYAKAIACCVKCGSWRPLLSRWSSTPHALVTDLTDMWLIPQQILPPSQFAVLDQERPILGITSAWTLWGDTEEGMTTCSEVHPSSSQLLLTPAIGKPAKSCLIARLCR